MKSIVVSYPPVGSRGWVIRVYPHYIEKRSY